jgi:hypothetical protein
LEKTTGAWECRALDPAQIFEKIRKGKKIPCHLIKDTTDRKLVDILDLRIDDLRAFLIVLETVSAHLILPDETVQALEHLHRPIDPR